MAQNVKEVLAGLHEVEGFIAVAVGHAESGMAMGTLGGNDDIDPELAVAANADVIKAKLRAMRALKIDGRIEDILVTLDDQYHLIRVLERNPNVFIYLILDRKRSNLAMARFKLSQAEDQLVL
jgi:hypothetical protein